MTEHLQQQIDELREIVSRMDPPEMMNTHEAAAFLGVSEPTMFRWRKDGFGPKYYQPTPRVLRYRKADLIEFLEQGGV